MGESPDLLLDRLQKNVAKFPDKTAVTFLAGGSNGGKVEHQLTYKDLAAETSALAARLRSSGLEKGERVVLVYPPSLDFMVAFLACLKAGVVAVPVFPPNPTRKDTMLMFSRIVKGCGAERVLTSVSYNHMKKVVGIKDSIRKLKRVNTTWPDDLEWIVTNDKSSSSNASQLTEIQTQLSADDIAFLQYTSGSTSEPKGVMITHGNLGHNLTIITNELKAVEDTVVVSWLPQYHDMGLIGSYLGVLYCGGSGYYMSPLSFLSRPMLWLEAVSKYRATHLQAPNFAFKLTARKLNAADYRGKLDLSSVRHIINGAEPVDEDSIVSFYDSFGPFGLKEVIYPTYGLAEHTVFVCSGGTQRLMVSKHELEVNGEVVLVEQDSSETETSKLLGCGYPARQGVDVRVVATETLEQLREDAVGEVWINSPSKAAGYFGRDEVTAEDFGGQLAGTSKAAGISSAYLRTGDLGFLHNNELFICGRLKDLIIVGGRNYYPQDIEATAEAAVSDAVRPGCSAAFTIDPTSQGDEEVALVMELRDVPKAQHMDEVCGPIVETIRAAILEEHSLGISKICLLKTRTVPKTTSGKIARSWCRKGFVADTLDTVYKKSFKESSLSPMEMEQTTPTPATQTKKIIDPKDIRAMDKKDIVAKLVDDVSRIAQLPPETIRKDVALAAILDSLSISQFKGQLEAQYATKLSDEYLFRETTTLTKLADVVKLGYAPDDDGHEGGDNATGAVATQGDPGGLAGALGCPPGVVCCVVM